MNWISLRELVLIHELVISKTGGVHGIINPATLESALLRPFSSFEGQEHYPDIWSKTAAFIHSIISFHPFADGNKRTAFVAAEIILKLNGSSLKSSQENDDFFWAIARGEKSVDEIKEWLKSHTEQG